MLSLFRRIPTISAPTIGFLDLTEGEASIELAADRAAISPLFGSSEDSSFEPPRCNVLFLYCHIEPDGSIRGYNRSVREVIRDSGAAVVVVATENSAESYIASTKKQRYGHANLVMVLDRRGDVFPRFFQRLFTEMKRGVSMPVAWVKLAPQIPGADHADCPDTIFPCEAGQLAFK
ncbi:MAG: hypothetical protein DME75_10375 [Verrucomicrobia bacterium]|nr:MAG: hypothetical protein DME75_10375 [Verrucomicrobiota bacterium]